MNPFHKVVFYPISVEAAAETINTVKRSPIDADGNPVWKQLTCCGGACTRGICTFHNFDPEEEHE